MANKKKKPTNPQVDKSTSTPSTVVPLVEEMAQTPSAFAIEEKPVSHEVLLRCLYFLYDAFERAMIDFFLIRQTAKSAINGNPLSHHIDIGVRKNEWITGKEILFMFFGDEHVKVLMETDDIITYEYQEAPFVIHIYEDNPCLLALNSIVYEYESFKLPNMIEIFEKEYDKSWI